MRDTDHDRDADDEPGLVMFAAAMRCVLRTRPGSTADGPDALETWTRADGYVWRWSTPAGMWRVTVGGAADAKPLLHGPGGFWRVDAEPGEYAVGLVLLMLRSAGAVPPAPQPAAVLAEGWQRPPTALAEFARRRAERAGGLVPSNRVSVQPGAAVARGEQVTGRPYTVEPLRAVLFRPSDPAPTVSAGYVAVPVTADRPYADGRWEIVMPDGMLRSYDPARRALIPYATGSGGTGYVLFETDQLPRAAV